MMMTTVKEVDMSVKLTPRKKLFVKPRLRCLVMVQQSIKSKSADDKAGVPFPTWFKEVQGWI